MLRKLTSLYTLPITEVQVYVYPKIGLSTLFYWQPGFGLYLLQRKNSMIVVKLKAYELYTACLAMQIMWDNLTIDVMDA